MMQSYIDVRMHKPVHSATYGLNEGCVAHVTNQLLDHTSQQLNVVTHDEGNEGNSVSNV